jgi:hypothetical protein
MTIDENFEIYKNKKGNGEMFWYEIKKYC